MGLDQRKQPTTALRTHYITQIRGTQNGKRKNKSVSSTCVALRAVRPAVASPTWIVPFQALIVKAEASFSLPEAELNAFVDKLFAFSFVWSIAGSVQEEG